MPDDFQYSVDDVFNPSSVYYNGALRFGSLPPSAQNTFLGGISPATLSAGEIVGNTTVTDGYLKSQNYVAGSTGWYLDPTTGEFNFAVTLGVGSLIGGFEVGADYIRDVANSFGMASTVTGGDDVRFWAGDTYANRATADFRVTEAGTVTARDITATGTINATAGYAGSATALVYESTGINTGVTGHIRGGQTDYFTGTGFFLGYSGAAYKFSLGSPTSYLTFDGTDMVLVGTQRVVATFTAGQTLTAGKPLFIAAAGDGTNTTISNDTDNAATQDLTNGNHLLQTFLVDTNAYQVVSVQISVKKNGDPGAPITVKVYDVSGGVATGSILGQASLAQADVSTSQTSYVFTVSANVVAGHTYGFYIEGAGADSSNCYSYYTNPNSYANGTLYKNDVDQSIDLRFIITEARTTAGSVHIASSIATVTSDAFIGFSYASASAAGTALVVVSGTVAGLSGLTVGGRYYLNNEVGTIGTSAGTQSRKVGIAVSATTLLITNLW